MKYSKLMNNNKRNIINLLCVIVLLSCFMGCCRNSCVTSYTFQVEMDVLPNEFELTQGDTLYVGMETDNTSIVDSDADRIVNFPNFDPNVYFMLSRLDSTEVLDGFDYNEIIVDDSYETEIVLVGPLSNKGLFFLEIDTTELVSKLDFRIVLNHPGTYGLQINPAISVNWRNIEFPGKCESCGEKGPIDAVLSVDGSRHKHVELLTEDEMANEDIYWSERSGSRYSSSAFYFRVEE